MSRARVIRTHLGPSRHTTGRTRRPLLSELPMLYTVAVVLLVLWALGFFGGYVFGGLLHLLLVIAVVMVVLRLLSGRRLT
jgi:hypothetical protein